VQQDGESNTEDGQNQGQLELDEYGECEHGGDGLTCPPCMNKRKGTVVSEQVKVSYHFIAKVDLTCQGCGLPIYRNQWVTRWSNDTVKHHGC